MEADVANTQCFAHAPKHGPRLEPFTSILKVAPLALGHFAFGDEAHLREGLATAPPRYSVASTFETIIAAKQLSRAVDSLRAFSGTD
jgi:hypothetical protein